MLIKATFPGSLCWERDYTMGLGTRPSPFHSDFVWVHPWNLHVNKPWHNYGIDAYMYSIYCSTAVLTYSHTDTCRYMYTWITSSPTFSYQDVEARRTVTSRCSWYMQDRIRKCVRKCGILPIHAGFCNPIPGPSDIIHATLYSVSGRATHSTVLAHAFRPTTLRHLHKVLPSPV